MLVYSGLGLIEQVSMDQMLTSKPLWDTKINKALPKTTEPAKHAPLGRKVIKFMLQMHVAVFIYSVY